MQDRIGNSMFDEDLISRAHIEPMRPGEPEQLRIVLRLPWYRSLPLSTLDEIRLKIDGEAISSEKISFRLNGHIYPFQELKHLYEVTWFVLDAADLFVTLTNPLADAPHKIAVTLFVRIPYHKGPLF